MTSQTPDQSAQNSQTSQIFSKAHSDAASVYPARLLNLASNSPVKKGKAKEMTS